MYRSLLLALTLLATNGSLQAQRVPGLVQPPNGHQAFDPRDIDLDPWGRREAAGTSRTVRPGARVRIWSDLVSSEFQVVAVSGDYLVVHGDDGSTRTRAPVSSSRRHSIGYSSARGQVRIPIRSISQLQVSGGRRSRLPGARHNLLIAGGIGALVGGTISYITRSDPVNCIFCGEAGIRDGALTVGVVFGTVGFLVGLASPGQYWTDVPLPDRLSIAPSRDGGVALGYQFGF